MIGHRPTAGQMAVVGVTTAPDLKTKENMYGDAMVELTDHDVMFHDAKLGNGGDPDAQPAGIRPSDSWLDVTQSAKERRGMHVTFQVREMDLPCVYRCCLYERFYQSALHTLTSGVSLGLSSLAHRIMREFGLLPQDVHYIVRNSANKREKLSILSGVSGYFNPGEMAAVMGPSGSGAPF